MTAAGLLPERGDRMTISEVIGLLMLIIAVINLAIKLAKKK